MFNKIPFAKTVGDYLSEAIKRAYSTLLKSEVESKRYNQGSEFTYHWSFEKGEVDIVMTKKLVSYDIDREGIRAVYLVKPQDDNNWISEGSIIPELPFNPRYFLLLLSVYGDLQQSVSLNFY